MAIGDKFDREIKVAAVHEVLEGELTAFEVAQSYHVHENTIRKWVKQYQANPDDAFPGSGNLKPSEEELTNLRRKVRQLELENDFLKKTAAYFAANPPKNMR